MLRRPRRLNTSALRGALLASEHLVNTEKGLLTEVHVNASSWALLLQLEGGPGSPLHVHIWDELLQFIAYDKESL